MEAFLLQFYSFRAAVGFFSYSNEKATTTTKASKIML